MFLSFVDARLVLQLAGPGELAESPAADPNVPSISPVAARRLESRGRERSLRFEFAGRYAGRKRSASVRYLCTFPETIQFRSPTPARSPQVDAYRPAGFLILWKEGIR